MKKIFSFLMVAVLALVLAGCEKYDDTELRNKVNGYESRIAALESLASYQTLLQKLEAGKTVTSYSKSDDIITLTFSDGSSVSFNQKGPKGDPGDPGESIQGDPGTPGQDGKTPEVKIENDKWYVRYGEDGTWKEIGSAVDRSLIKDIKAEGGVLKITLADGSVVNVPYGEKEGYGFSVDRNVLFSFENQKAFREGEFLLPYTLTGDIKNIDDVRFAVNVTNYGGTYFAPYRQKLEVEPTDAKSGFFHIYRKGYIRPSNGVYGSYEDGEWWIDYPAVDFDVTAYFPDGTSRFEKIKVLGYDIYISPTNGDYVEWSSTYNQPWLPLPSSLGNYAFTVNITMFDYYKYDLEEPAQLAFDDIFRAEQSTPIFTTAAPPTKTGPTMQQTEEKDLLIQYVVTYHYIGFTGTGTRKSTARIGKWESSNSYGNLMYVTFTQTN